MRVPAPGTTGKSRPPHQALQIAHDPHPWPRLLDLADRAGGGLYVGAWPDDGAFPESVFEKSVRVLLEPTDLGKLLRHTGQIASKRCRGDTPMTRSGDFSNTL